MNLAFVRYFLAVVDSGSFTTAAERCHVTQPTLSAGIARLEHEMGAKLFDRGRRAALSSAGHRLLPHARTMLDTWQAARAESRSSRRPRMLRVAIGSTVPTAAAMPWMASAQRRAGIELGGVELEIAEGTAEAVAERWRRGRCDMALFATRVPLTAPNSASLWREPYVLAAATSHRVATRDHWSVADLADTAFVLRAGCEAHAEAERLFASHGVRPRAVLRSADEERCALAVLEGLGASLMPRSLLRPGLAAAAIREVELERRVVLAWREAADGELVAGFREAALAHPWPGRNGVRDDRLAYAR
ncbi:MAG: LysR family transcriptional regulator [Alphaproteobacteria bacterium]|nr:LysR family transcriptional regulator [Alphaproteobacteria bacterium]